MSNQGQDLLSHFYLGFVCCVLILGPYLRLAFFQDHWSSGLYVHDFGPRTRNDLDLQYSHSFINSIKCLLLPTFRSLAAIVSDKSIVFTFSYGKAQNTKFDLAVK